MIETILLAILLSYKRGYQIDKIWKEKAFYPLLACELLYWGIQLSIFTDNYGLIQYATIFKSVYLCSTLFIVFRYELYSYAILGSACVLLGGWCNDLAIAVNNGQMPVYPTLSRLTGYVKMEAFGVADQLHVLGNEATRLKGLTDIFDIGYSVLSIGDVLIRVLPFIIVYQGLRAASTKGREMKRAQI
ncbi:MAG: DUF5317 family protein [Cellulosilyticaceae bacterium]